MHIVQLLTSFTCVYNDDIKTEFLFCKTSETTMTAKDIFKLCLTLFEEHGIEWENLCAIWMDGAPVTLGCRSSFQGLIKLLLQMPLAHIVWFIDRCWLWKLYCFETNHVSSHLSGKLFTKKGKIKFKDLFRKDEKLNQIAYLAGMFDLLNQLNTNTI